jgi:signal transduction histidine kinase
METPSKSRALASRQRTLAGAAAAAGILLSAAAAWMSATSGRARAQSEFRAAAEGIADSFRREVESFFEVLQSIGLLHDLSDQISPEEFGEFSQKGMAYQLRLLGAYGLTQREMPSGQPDDPASQRPIYRLTYQRPEQALGVPLGYDFAALPQDARAIAQMMQTGKPAVGSPLLGANPYPDGLFAFAPIMYTNVAGVAVPPPGYLIGFAVAILRPEDMLTGIIPASGRDFYRARFIFPATAAEVAEGRPRRALDRDIDLAGMAGVLRVEPLPAFFVTRQTSQPWVILGAGLALTALLALQLRFLAGRADAIEATVFSRTAELRAANARLEEEMAERRRLESEMVKVGTRERERLGRDLHDSLGQKLAGSVYLSKGLARHLEGAAEEARDAAARLHELLKETTTQARRMARGLAPVDVGDEGLADALRRLAEDTSGIYGIACTADVSAEVRPPNDDAAVHLFHIAEESVNNAIRHGKAARVEIALTRAGADGRLVIRDHGAGLAAGHERKGGMGLLIMRHRAEVIGGRLAIGTAEGGGTQVACEFPAASPDTAPPPA